MKKTFRPDDLVLRFFSYVVIFSFLAVSPAAAVDLTGQGSGNRFLGTLRDAGDDLIDALPADGSYLFNSAISDVADAFKLPFQDNEIGVRKVLVASLIIGAIPERFMAWTTV